MKAILMSIRPKWCELIANGAKTIEVRKTAPKEVPFKVYIYQTKKRWIYKLLPWLEKRQAKVVGEFICDKVDTYGADVIACAKWEVNGGEVKEHLRYNAGACLTAEEMFDYSNGKSLRGLHISDLKIYDKPKKLSEFRPWCKKSRMTEDNLEMCCKCNNAFFTEDGVFYDCGLRQAPQSWQYVEEL